jgi:spore germination protein YaaH
MNRRSSNWTVDRRFFTRALSGTVWFGVVLGIFAQTLAARERRFVSHFYLVNEPASRQSLQSNYKRISLVSPQWFVIDQNGRLISTVNEEVAEWARHHHVLLMPLLTNQNFQPAAAHAALSNEKVIDGLAQQILEASPAHHFYGLQIDFENLPAEDRELLTRFVRTLRKELRSRHMKISVAVPLPLTPAPPAATPRPPPPGPWVPNEKSRAFDYQALSEISDFITLMAYDEYASPGQPGPIAGFPWVSACVEKILEVAPSKKLMLGVPLYFRLWDSQTVRDGPSTEALALAERSGATVQMDPMQKEKTFQIQEGSKTSVIWLEDPESLREKLALVNRYQLAGFSAWRLGQEAADAWTDAFPKKAGKPK